MNDEYTSPAGSPETARIGRAGTGAGCWIAIALLSIVLIVSVFANFALLLGLLFTAETRAFGRNAADEYPDFEEYLSYGRGDIKAVRMFLDGVISRDPGGGLLTAGIDRTELMLRQIQAARQDEKVKAIILEIDSPGGVMTPTDEIYQALQGFRESAPDRKVVVLVRDMAASGAYYIAMASDWIIAEPTAIIGSIGVILQTVNWKDLSEKIGIRGVTLTAGDNKDLLNPFEEVNPEHLEIFQNILNDMHARFVNIVQNRLQLDESVLASLTDGRIFTADQAVAVGMIDQLGYWDDALARTRELFDDRPVRVVRYEQPRGLSRLLAQLSAGQPAIRLPAALNPQHPRIMYLWTP